MASITRTEQILKQKFFSCLPVFSEYLSASDILTACRICGYQWRERCWAPVETFWTFLLQVLHNNCRCREAGVGANDIALWNGASFSALGSGITSGGTYPGVLTMSVFDDGNSPGLYAAWNFTAAAGGTAHYIAKWSAPAWAYISQQPASQNAHVGDSVTLSVSASAGAPFSYRWYRDDSPLSGGDNISGTATSTLTINPAAVADSGDYDVTVTTRCGSVTSDVAIVTVRLAGDVNNDGHVDSEDEDQFSMNWLGSDCEAPDWCGGADMDGNGQVDILDFAYIAEHWLED